AFDNSGTLEVQSGTIRFDYQGTSSGIFNLSAGTTAYPPNGFTFTPTHRFWGAGTNLWTTGTITANCALCSNQFLLAGASLSGTNLLTSVMNWTSGYINSEGAF